MSTAQELIECRFCHKFNPPEQYYEAIVKGGRTIRTNMCRRCHSEKSRFGGQNKRRKDPPKRMTAVGKIYFVLAPDVQRIKIGFSESKLEKRINALRGQCPVTVQLLGVIVGTRVDERALHTQFQSYSSHGEWFNYTPELQSKVEAILMPP